MVIIIEKNCNNSSFSVKYFWLILWFAILVKCNIILVKSFVLDRRNVGRHSVPQFRLENCRLNLRKYLQTVTLFWMAWKSVYINSYSTEYMKPGWCKLFPDSWFILISTCLRLEKNFVFSRRTNWRTFRTQIQKRSILHC